MTINQEPTNGSTYFSKAVPDIIMTKSGTDTFILLELKKDATVILSEKYMFDANNSLRVREIGSIFEKYLSANALTSAPVTSNVERSSALVGSFSAKITLGAEVHTTTFTVLKCDAEISVDALPWCATNFLTRSFRQKCTAKERTEYLSFFQKASFGTITIHCKLFYGANLEIEFTMGTIASVSADTITTINTSINRLISTAGLTTATRIYQAHIWLTGTSYTSSVYGYLVDESTTRNQTQFGFINCFGVPETFTATGKVENKKTAEYNQANIASHYRKITQNFVSEKTINSGYLSAQEMTWIDDFICSNNVSLIAIGEPITLVGIDKVESSINKLQYFTFGYRSAKNNHLQFINANSGVFDETFDTTFE